MAAAEIDGRRFKRQGTELYSDSIAFLKNDFGKTTQAMNVEGIGRISYMANAGCRGIARLISNRAEQSDVAVAMRTCCDWAGYNGLKPVPRDMAERLLRLCVSLVSHANKVLLVIGGPSTVWGLSEIDSEAWDIRVHAEVELVRSWAMPCVREQRDANHHRMAQHQKQRKAML